MADAEAASAPVSIMQPTLRRHMSFSDAVPVFVQFLSIARSKGSTKVISGQVILLLEPIFEQLSALDNQ